MSTGTRVTRAGAVRRRTGCRTGRDRRLANAQQVRAVGPTGASGVRLTNAAAATADGVPINAAPAPTGAAARDCMAVIGRAAAGQPSRVRANGCGDARPKPVVGETLLMEWLRIRATPARRR